MSKIGDVFDPENYLNNQQLRPLQPEDKLNTESVSDEKKAELRLQHALSVPANETNVRGVSALPLKKNLAPEYSGEIKTDEKVAEPVIKIGVDSISADERDANHLNYSVGKNKNLVRYRTLERQYYHNKVYKEKERLEITPSINGGAYINGKGCYIHLKYTSGQEATFGLGSVVNLFKRSYIMSNDGKILDDHNGVNLKNITYDYWKKTADYIETLGAIKGYGSTEPEGLDHEFIVHLSDIFEIFNTDVLLPPELLNNCRLVIEFEDAVKALYNTDIGVQNGVDAEYSVFDIEVVYDVCYLNQDVVNLLHKQNIIFEYKTYECVNKTDNKFVIENEKKDMVGVYVIRRENTSDLDDLYLNDYAIDGKIFHSKYTFSSDNVKKLEVSSLENYLNNHNYFRNENDKNNLTFSSGNEKFYIESWDLTNNFTDEGRKVDNYNLIEYQNDTNESNLYFVFIEYRQKIEIRTIDPVSASKMIMPKIIVEK